MVASSGLETHFQRVYTSKSTLLSPYQNGIVLILFAVVNMMIEVVITILTE